ncbi:MAG: hypothetical protein AB1742_11060 [bacterium]
MYSAAADVIAMTVFASMKSSSVFGLRASGFRPGMRARMKSPLGRLSSALGLGLPEMLIAFSIMFIVSAAVANVMVNTARAYVTTSDQSLVQGNAKWALDRMITEIRAAEPGGSIFGTSDADSISFVKHGEDLEGLWGLPNAGESDTVCYQFCPPFGSPTSESYQPGYIQRGVNSASNAACAGMSCNPADGTRITDNHTDIRALSISYCVPSGAATGELSCYTSPALADPDPSHDYVWLVAVTMTAARRANLIVGTDPVTFELKSSVQPRTIYLTSLSDDKDYDGTCDICEGVWCAPLCI